MNELFDFLVHPSRWSAIEALSPAQRLWLAVGALVITFGVASVAGLLSSRWARRRSERAGASANVERLIGRVRRGLVMVLFAFGAYWAAEMAPLPKRLDGVVSGVTYVFGAVMLAWLTVSLATLLLTTSVAHVSADDRARFEREYVPLASKLVMLAVGLILLVVVAKHFGRDLTSLIAALGVGSLAIGLAAQQTLGNMIAGFVLLVDRPFRTGDRIKLASGESGEVMDVGVRSTRIVLTDDNLLIVPNTELANSRVINFGYPSLAVHSEVRVPVAHGADLERATQILATLAAEDERIAKEPAPAVRVTGLSSLSVELTLGYEVSRHVDAPAVEDQLRRKLLRQFAAAGVALPAIPGLPSPASSG